MRSVGAASGQGSFPGSCNRCSLPTRAGRRRQRETATGQCHPLRDRFTSPKTHQLRGHCTHALCIQVEGIRKTRIIDEWHNP